MSETPKRVRDTAQVLADFRAHWTNLNPREVVAALDEQDALIARLRSELAACHKVIIDAMAELNDGSPSSIIMDILDSAPEPSDETLAAIEAGGE